MKKKLISALKAAATYVAVGAVLALSVLSKGDGGKK